MPSLATVLSPSDADRCLLADAALLALSRPDAAGLLYRRSNISGWYKYWFSLHGSQLLYFERAQSNRRGLLLGTISLFRNRLTLINTVKRRREFEVIDNSNKLHILRADSDAELHWWLQLFAHARNKIPPAHPIAPLSIPPSTIPNTSTTPKQTPLLPNTVVDTHLRVDHVLCVVHGIGVHHGTLTENVRQLQQGYEEIMAKVFPDVDFGLELIVTYWRPALIQLDIHQRLRAVVPRAPFAEQGAEANPLKHLMEHRVIDYIYYTHARYRQHLLREVCKQLNERVHAFRQRRPEFTGKISVMGHSLGAALCYELLSRRSCDDQTLLTAEGLRLDFDVETLFCLGSPLGTLLSLDSTIGGGGDLMNLPFRVFNVFKYHDPIATRLEPLRDIRWAAVRPVTVPYWGNMGVRESTAQWFGSLWAGQRHDGEVRGGTNGEGDEGGDSKAGVDEADVTDGTIGVGRRKILKRRNGAKRSVSETERIAKGTERGVSGGRRRGSEGDDLGRMGDEWMGDLGSQASGCGAGGAPGESENGSLKTNENGHVRKYDESSEGVNATETEECGEMCVEASELDRAEVRFDYALQVSSTMEEMSTSWSALRSHSEYWGNRDAMLLMVSTMVKSTFGIADGNGEDDGRDEVKVDLERRIVDRDISWKEVCRGHVGKGGGRGGSVNEGGGDDVSKGVCEEENGGEEDSSEYVKQVVARVIEEAVAVHELVRKHPGVKVRSGGVGAKSPRVNDGAAGDGGGGGWASYLSGGWFGGDTSGTSSASGNTGRVESNVVGSGLAGGGGVADR